MANHIQQIFRAAVLPLSLLGLSLSGVAQQTDAPAYAQIKAGSKTFSAELATTRTQQRVGLMHRASLPRGQGLLMVMAEPRIVSIWMKNVLIPLDVVWLDADGGIVDVRTLPICAAAPCVSYHPGKPAKYVLEVGAGEFPLSRGGAVEITLPAAADGS